MIVVDPLLSSVSCPLLQNLVRRYCVTNTDFSCNRLIVVEAVLVGSYLFGSNHVLFRLINMTVHEAVLVISDWSLHYAVSWEIEYMNALSIICLFSSFWAAR